jgi:flagellar motor component MotA
MSSRDLPHQPSLRHLKQEAKQFHKALQDGDPQSTERIREGLPRLRPDAPVDDVTLMEVQHVLAREYGYREWPALAAAAELEFDQLSALSDADTQSLLRVTDQKDLVTALKLTSHDVKRRMLTAMSGRVCRFITEEMAFVDPSEAEIVDVQERILTQVRLLARDEAIGWPLGSDTPSPKPLEGLDLQPAIASRIDRPLSWLDLSEIHGLIHGLSERARANGILSLEAAANAATDTFVQEGVRLVVDGMEPNLLADLLKTRIRAILQHLDNRQLVILEGVVAICGGDNPQIVAHKISAVYQIDSGIGIEPTGASMQDLQAHLRVDPASTLNLDMITSLLVDLSELARRVGLPALAPLADDIDDAMLREGVNCLAARLDMKEIVETLQAHKDRAMSETQACLHTFTAGLTALQEGKKEVQLDEAMVQQVQ